MVSPALVLGALLLLASASRGGGSGEVLSYIARLEAELARGSVDEFTVKAVMGSRDPRTFDVLLALLAAPESIRRPHGKFAFEFAVVGLSQLGDQRAIPGLRQFLQSRLTAPLLADDSQPPGTPYPTGKAANYRRRLDALHAARALYTLGDWRSALDALDALVHDPHVIGWPLYHLYLAAQLDVERFAAGSEARDSTVTFLRRACASPDLLVQAHAAHSLAAADPDISYQTAVRLLSTGPDKSPGSRSYKGMHKRTAIRALSANRSAQSREFLKALANDSDPLIRSEARQALDRH